MSRTRKHVRTSRATVVLGVVALAVAAAACGSDAKSSTTTGTPASAASTTAASGATTTAGGGASTTGAGATTTAGGSTAPSTPAGGGEVGVPGTAAAEGFEVDLDKCTDKEAATKKITDTWKVGYSAPLSGPIAGVANYDLDGFKARLAAQNAAGGIDGVKIEVTYKDDQFTPDKAKANATEFLQSDKVDSLSTFGSGPVSAMADDQNAECVPLLYPSSSVQQYRDISEYPWTVQFLPAGEAEARYDVGVILQQFPDGAKVGIAENQTTSGKGESAAFQKEAEGTKLNIAVIAPSTDPNAAATQMKEANVDVVYNAGVSTDCGPMVQAMDRIGFTPKLVVNPSNCADINAYITAGQAANGNVLPVYLKDPADPAMADDAGVKQYLSEVTTDDKNNSITVAGWVQADLLISTLKMAAASPEGLTHASVIAAARNLRYASPMLIDGIEWVSTPTELTGVNAFQTTVWDAANQKFVAKGDLISVAAK